MASSSLFSPYLHHTVAASGKENKTHASYTHTHFCYFNIMRRSWCTRLYAHMPTVTRPVQGLVLTFSSRYPITRKPFPPSICSCMATELFSSSTRNASRVALQDTLRYTRAALVLLATSRFCMFLFHASLFTLLSGCILVCNHCLPDN